MIFEIGSIPFQTLLFGYVFYYPLVMSVVWTCGGLAHSLVLERQRHKVINPLSLLPAASVLPMVTVVVPCHNEAAHVREVINQVMRTNYPNYEVIAVNDGSKDGTDLILNEMAQTNSRLRVVHHAKNQGKAVGLNTAALLARSEYILGIDGDALLDPDAIAWLMVQMLQYKRLGAVTGNPRIRNRTSLLGRMQVGEFSSIVGLIKRTQQLVLGRLFTVSGVIAMFRRKALLQVGFWSPDALTEDIDVSWKLQLAGWSVSFEPRALCWILMPETLRGLLKQRLRWATGGIQTMLRNFGALLDLRQWRLWPIALEYLASVFWAYAMFFVMVLAALRYFLPISWQVGFVPEWHGIVLGIACMVQLLSSMWIDRHYDRDLLRYFAWTIWYPLGFWLIGMLVTVVAVPKSLLRRRGKRATWTSPDRGINHAP